MIGLGIGLGLGGRAGGSTAVYDPSALSLTCWLKPTYVGSPWVGSASAGTSGANDATEATNPPNTHASGGADFDGTNDELTLDGTTDTYLSAAAYSGWAVVDIDAISTNAADHFNDDSIIATGTSGYFAITLRDNGGTITATVVHWNGSNQAASVTVTTGLHVLHWYYDGTNLRIGVDGTWGTALATGTGVGALTNTLRIGINSAGGQFFDGRVLEVGLSDTALSEATLDTDIVGYAQTTYGTP